MKGCVCSLLNFNNKYSEIRKKFEPSCCLCSFVCCSCLYKEKDTVMMIHTAYRFVVCICVWLCVCLLKAHSGSVLAGSVNRNEKKLLGLGIHWIQLPLIITAVRCSMPIQHLTGPWLQSHPSFATDGISCS